ncbi:MAG: hypothetical protein WC516_04115 [Patescibacteria group bacterium]
MVVVLTTYVKRRYVYARHARTAKPTIVAIECLPGEVWNLGDFRRAFYDKLIEFGTWKPRDNWQDAPGKKRFLDACEKLFGVRIGSVERQDLAYPAEAFNAIRQTLMDAKPKRLLARAP